MSRTSLTESPEVLATKGRIAASTLKEVRKHGILGLRLADVAEGANVSIPLIYKYFDDRDGLLAAVLGEIIERHFDEELDSIQSTDGDAVEEHETRGHRCADAQTGRRMAP